MKLRTLFLMLAVMLCAGSFAQSYDQQRTALRNFLVRMYKTAPFEGVKVVSDYSDNYLLSVVLVKKSGSEIAMNRIAQVKSQRQVSQYLNSLTTIDSETVIRTTEDAKSGQTLEEVTDIIKEHSIGYTKAMEVLSTFDTPDNQTVYMFFRKIEEMEQ